MIPRTIPFVARQTAGTVRTYCSQPIVNPFWLQRLIMRWDDRSFDLITYRWHIMERTMAETDDAGEGRIYIPYSLYDEFRGHNMIIEVDIFKKYEAPKVIALRSQNSSTITLTVFGLAQIAEEG